MCFRPGQSARCCLLRTRNPQPPPRGMREPLVSGSREAGGVRGVARQRGSAAVGVRVGERALFLGVRGGGPVAELQELRTLLFVIGEGSLLLLGDQRRPRYLETGEEHFSIAK